MTKRILRYIILAFAALLPLMAGAQADNAPKVRAVMEPDSISIGDHFRLRVEVDKDMMQVVDFPSFEDNMAADNLHVIQDIPADTISGESRRQKIIKEYLLTCFDAGLYEFGEFPVLYVDKNIVDTLFSEDKLRLLVTTFEVDTMANTIYDIKRPEAAPLLVSEFGGYVKWTLVILCALAAIIWLISKAIAKRKPVEQRRPLRLAEPPHVRAIRELEDLNNKKLWQNNKHKFYYTRLVDILREYLEGRYGIGAMEMTSDEIMAAVAGLGLTEKNYGDLRGILYTSDLVKFAKHVPDTDMNEKVWYDAFYFVEDTKETLAEESAGGPKLNEFPEDGE